jgi:hypothetical protein
VYAKTVISAAEVLSGSGAIPPADWVDAWMV